MDYVKAFDTEPNRKLIHKLSVYGITEEIVSWINSFLSNRIHQVVMHGEESTWKPVTSEIPKGSFLGPLLFVIFISDFSDCVTSDAYLFADDTKYSEV